MTHPFRSYVRLVLLTFASLTVVAAASAADGERVAGRVLDPDGRPVAGATVIADGAAASAITTLSDAEGRFEVALPGPGQFRLQAMTAGLSAPARAIVVAPGERATVDVVLRLTAVDEQLVVSASQVDQAISTLPDSATVISGDTLASRQQFATAQALRSVPGLTVQQSGGPGSLASLFLRGGESDYTLVLIDGVRANAFGGGIDLSQVPLADVERIEVVRGPQSALYGADAIGGVVQVITKSGGVPSVQGLFETGSREMWRTTASTTGGAGSWRWQAGGDHFREEGFTGEASNGERVSNDDARTSQASVVVGWRGAASGSDIQASLRYVDTDRGTPGAVGSDPAGRFSGVDRTARNLTVRRTAALRWLQPWFGAGSSVRQRTELDVADFDLTSRSAFPSTGESARVHLRSQTDAALGSAIGVTGGFEWLGEDGRSTFITSGSPSAPTPVERSVLGVFGEVRLQPATRLSVTAGVRSERIHRSAFAGDPEAFTPRPDFPADTVVSVNPKLAASWLLLGDPAVSRRWTRVHGAAGTGIRPPDAFEIAFTDNAGLAPERSRSGEIGLSQVWQGGALQLDATAFVNDYDDLIISVGRNFAGASRWRTDNISNARARGLETSAAWRPAGALGLQATYTWLSTEILAVDGAESAPPPYSVGDRLLRRPRHQGTIDATWSRGRATGFGQLLMRGATLDAEPAFGPTGGLYDNPGYAVANLGGSFRLARRITVQARVMNLFDRRYEEVLGFPSPGRLLYAGVRLAASR